MPEKYPLSFFERTANWCLKGIGGALVGVKVLLMFMPGLVVLGALAPFVSEGVASSMAAIAWGLWIFYWERASKLPQVRAITSRLNDVIHLCFKASDPRYFEEWENK